jgi:hypothetical protein
VLIQQHQQKEKTLTEAHKQNLQVIHNNYWKDVYGIILNHQDTYLKVIERHHSEYMEFLIKMQEEEDSLYSTQILEIEELAKDQSLPDTEKREYYDTIFTFQDYVKKQHIDQMRELMTIHKEELTTLKKNQKLQRQEVKKNAPALLSEYAKKIKESDRRKDLEEGPSPPSFVPAPPSVTALSLNYTPVVTTRTVSMSSLVSVNQKKLKSKTSLIDLLPEVTRKTTRNRENNMSSSSRDKDKKKTIDESQENEENIIVEDTVNVVKEDKYLYLPPISFLSDDEDSF